jgi:6-bladed beta-propeller
MEDHRRLAFASLVLPALIFAAPMTGAPQAEWKGTIVKEGDVTVVKNPKEPLYKTPVLELKEELSIGGPDAQGEAAFGSIRGVVMDDRETIFILDQQAAHIKVFDAAGKFLRTIGRKGQGPGELEYPMSLSLNRAKGELAVLLQTRGLVVFGTDGSFLRQQSFKGLITPGGRVDSRGNAYVLEIVFGDKGTHYAIKKLGPDGSLLAMISETPAPAGPGNAVRAFIPIPYFLVDRDDRFFFGYPEAYEIRVFGPAEAKVLRKIAREYDPVAVTEDDKAERRRDVPPGFNREFIFPERHPAYSRFFLSDLGHLFVQTMENTEGGRFIHDVFDAEGRFIGRIPLKPAGIGIMKGKYYALEEDTDGYQVVKRYAVTWKVK